MPAMTDWLHGLFWNDGHFQGWEIVGWLGNSVFFARFFVQWYATERKKQVVVPVAFWWLSLAGSLLLLTYALFSHTHPNRRNWVFVASYAFTWIPYVRNLIIHRRHEDAQIKCATCGTVCPPKSNFCLACGARLEAVAATMPAHR
jgi:lipid-A-disaccharide synthase-like uncharacterized protein